MKRRGSLKKADDFRAFSRQVGLRSFGEAAQSHRKLEGLIGRLQKRQGILSRLLGMLNEGKHIQGTMIDLQQVVIACEQYITRLLYAQRGLGRFKKIAK